MLVAICVLCTVIDYFVLQKILILASKTSLKYLYMYIYDQNLMRMLYFNENIVYFIFLFIHCIGSPPSNFFIGFDDKAFVCI